MAYARQAAVHRLLLEREAELAAIDELVRAAKSGSGALLAFEGRAGIGKTTLLDQVRATAADLDVLSARGGELEQEFAFGVVRQLFEPRLAAIAAEEAAELMSGAAALAIPLFENRLADGGRAADPSFAMLHGLYWLTANLAARRPLVLRIDDLHWADGPSLRWVGYLARRLEGIAVLLAVATRPPEESANPTLLTEILTSPAAIRIAPDALGRPGVAAVVRDALGDGAEAAFVDACHAATRGNPLYLRAVIDTLAAEGVTPVSASAGRVLETGPEAVSRAVALRLARIEHDAAALIRSAAVLGDDAPLPHAAALVDLDVERAAHAASALVRAGLLDREDPLRFVHPVVRTAIYRDTEADERSALHRRAGKLLVEAGAPREQAAGHLVLALPQRDPFVVRTLRAAADRALSQGAPDAAVAYLRRALEEPPADDDRAAILRELGLSELHVDAFAAVGHLRDALALTRDPIARAEAALLYARALIWIDDFTVAVDVLAAALDELGAREPSLREMLEAVLIGSSLWTPELRDVGQSWIARVDEHRFGDALGAAVLRSHLAFHELRAGVSRERAVDLAERALASGTLTGSETIWSLTAIVVLALAECVDQARAAYDRAVADARRRGDLLDLVPLLLLRGWLSLQRGDLLAAEEDLRSSELDLAQAASTTSAYRAGFLAELLLEQGRAEEAARTVDALRGNEPTHSEYRLFYLYARARVALEAGRPAEALADLRAIAAEMEAVGTQNPALVAWRSQAALAQHRLGNRSEAVELAREEVEHAGCWGAARPCGVALRTLGLVEGGSAGELRLREAVEVLADTPARLEHARALVALGAALRRNNQRTAARDLLRRGADLAHRCGSVPLVRHAQDELAATGARPRRLLLTGVDALTPSERRVARMAAEGLSNKEIAQMLFVTVKAVEVHLSSAYRKLDIGSRRELPSALAGDDEAPA